MNRQLKVRGIAILDGKLLCVQLKPYPGSTHSEKEFWCLPGGGVDSGEPLPQALKREITEELGIEPKIGRLLYVQQFTHGGIDFTEFLFHIKNAQDYLTVDLSKTTHGHLEIKELAFIDPKTSVVLPEFLATEDLSNFTASNQPTKFFASY